MTSGHNYDRSARTHTVRMRVAQITAVGLALIGVVLALKPTSLAARNAEPTFAEDVAPILYKNCTTCHHPGGMGPFSLLDYDSAKAKTGEMRDAVAGRQMPPWHAEGPHGVFRNDRRLSDGDIQTIVRWIDAGAKPGDLSKMPPKPEYPDSWAIGTPDAIIAMPEPFVVPASGEVAYQYFEVPTNFTEDKWIQAMEIMPGAREAVHHVLLFATVPPAPGVATPPPAPQPAGAPASRPLLIRNPAHAALPRPSCSSCTPRDRKSVV